MGTDATKIDGLLRTPLYIGGARTGGGRQLRHMGVLHLPLILGKRRQKAANRIFSVVFTFNRCFR